MGGYSSTSVFEFVLHSMIVCVCLTDSSWVAVLVCVWWCTGFVTYTAGRRYGWAPDVTAQDASGDTADAGGRHGMESGDTMSTSVATCRDGVVSWLVISRCGARQGIAALTALV